MTDHSEARHEPVEVRELSFKTDPTGRPLTADMARGIIAVARTIRPGWSWHDVAAALDEVRDLDPVATTLATIAAAKNPNVTHPGVIAHSGIWWDAVDTYPPKPVEVKPVVNLADRRERRARGYSSRWDDPKFLAEFEEAAAEAEKARKAGMPVLSKYDKR